MCGGIEYQDQKIYFPQPDARLPARLRDGNVTWVTWVGARMRPLVNFRMAAGHDWLPSKVANGNPGTQDRF